MKKFTKQPSDYVRSSVDTNIDWQSIWKEARGAQDIIESCVQSDHTMWDTYAVARNAGDTNTIFELYEAAMQFNIATRKACGAFKKRISDINRKLSQYEE